jgi:hypothetical protein
MDLKQYLRSRAFCFDSFKYIVDAALMPFRGRHKHAGAIFLIAPKWEYSFTMLKIHKTKS